VIAEYLLLSPYLFLFRILEIAPANVFIAERMAPHFSICAALARAFDSVCFLYHKLPFQLLWGSVLINTAPRGKKMKSNYNN